MSSSSMIFASALMLSAVRAADHISYALNSLERATHEHEPIAPGRRFNLEAVLSPERSTSSFWLNPEHENEPPEHDPVVHEPMPKGPVTIMHEAPLDTKTHPEER